MPPADPTLAIELGLFAAGARYVIGCDEVGRGALAGPVAVGMAVIDVTVGAVPVGLRDSKLLSEPRREALAPQAIAWARHSAVGLADPQEVDELGLTRCLGLAGLRALDQLQRQGLSISGAVVLLDGKHDWLGPALAVPVRVHTRVQADRDCASVAAASVIAKVHRDRIMIEQDSQWPGFGWSSNKGYGSTAHLAAISELGATGFHRRSWLASLA